jgi:predicted AlkP superfamily phosphohydrolase/phosphomutase
VGRRGRAAAAAAGLFLCAWGFPGCGAGKSEPAPGPRAIVLGIDGLDYDLTREMLDEGRLPNLARLAAQGSFTPLGTAIPPQSPVAWSNFITGLDAGGHGIFDFFHRDPKTIIPYQSTSRTEGSESTLKLGKWQIPLSSGTVKLLRHGEPFWEVLEREGIDTTIIRMPANFPPSGTSSLELSGMGTPDLTGSYGIFSYYTTDYLPFAGRTLSGGKVYDVFVLDNTVQAKLYGPDNPFLVKKEKLTVDFTAYIDPVEPAAKFEVGDDEFILQVGEWSEWISFDFEMIPTQSLPAIARFYLKSVRPDFQLYVTPLNLDPRVPALPISTPEDYAAKLARATGLFYTQGMPEDTQALRGGVLTREEFLSQAKLAGDENIRQFSYVLDQWNSRFLFYYFGNVDQISHMLWRPMDPNHPAYDEVLDPPFSEVIKEAYEEMDAVVGQALERIDDDTLLVVMSDHGFTSFRRSFNPNTWLWDQGYLVLVDPSRDDPLGVLGGNVDWSRTRAYGLGLNALYINLAGREKRGIVPASRREQLMDEIAGNLLATIDPATGKPAITKVYRREESFKDTGYLDIGPDLIVGYAKGTRGADAAALGGIAPEVITDNTAQWTGGHLMDHEAVPGVLFTNRPLKKPAEELKQLAAAILAEFGIEGFPARNGTQ